MLALEEPPMARTPLSGKRFRPPTLDISQALERRPSIQVETGPTPVKVRPTKAIVDGNEDSDSDGDVFEDTLQLSSPESIDDDGPSSAIFTGVPPMPGTNDEIEKGLRHLETLRNNVKKNLELRPIRSRSNLHIDPSKGHFEVVASLASGRSPSLPAQPPDSASSTASWTSDNPPESAMSSYFTPLAETPYAIFSPGSSNAGNPNIGTTLNGFSAEPESMMAPPTNGKATRLPAGPISAKALYDRLTSSRRPLLIDARSLAAHEAFHIRTSINIAIPSLILKRCKKPGGGFQSLNALRQYITTEQGKAIWDDLIGQGAGPWDGDVVIYDDDMNINDKNNVGSTAWSIIPVISPLLSYGMVDYLEGGISSAGHDPDLQTLILTGEEANDLGVSPSFRNGRAQARTPQSSPGLQQKNMRKKASVGLFQLDTQTTYRSRQLPELEPSSTVSIKPPSPLPLPRSPLPMMPASSSSSSSSSHNSSTTTSPDRSDLNGYVNILDSSPSPPPSSLAGFRRPPPPCRPSAPNLRKLDTKSMERINTNLPKLSLRTKPMRSATLAAPPTLSLLVPTSPSHLKLTHSTHSPMSPVGRSGPASAYPAESGRYMSPFLTPPHSPGTPKAAFSFTLDGTPPASPNPSTTSFSQHRQPHNAPHQLMGLQTHQVPDPPPTARPEAGFDFGGPPSTSEEEDAFPTFCVSTILPNFLFLGPELTTREQVEELKELGVKRIVNIAAECDDDQGLRLREAFKYLRIPMRDTVEEDNITRGVRVVCDFLDDARLHSAATYVHCKAGKSRSVTAVMAYLIHANRWTLSHAYAFVLERRKGISPNIGFVSELMHFEEQELGSKSVGVQPSAPSAGGGDSQDVFAAAVSSGQHSMSSNGGPSGGIRSHHGNLARSRTHVRDSLPPIGMDGTRNGEGPMSAGGLLDRVIGDSGQEMEIKDANGRYRHARRAPVNESTLQPMRRVSKAGLESSIYTS